VTLLLLLLLLLLALLLRQACRHAWSTAGQQANWPKLSAGVPCSLHITQWFTAVSACLLVCASRTLLMLLQPRLLAEHGTLQ
jgi:hypothetical protein